MSKVVDANSDRAVDVKWAYPYQTTPKDEHGNKVKETPGEEVNFTLPRRIYADDAEVCIDMNLELELVNALQLQRPLELEHWDAPALKCPKSHFGTVSFTDFDSADDNLSTRALYGTPGLVIFDASDSISEFELEMPESSSFEDDGMVDIDLENEMDFGNDDKDAWVLHLMALREAAYARQRDQANSSSSDSSSDHSDPRDVPGSPESDYHLAAAPRSSSDNVDCSKIGTELWSEGQPPSSRRHTTHKYAIAKYKHDPDSDNGKRKALRHAQNIWYKGWGKVGLVH